MRIQPWLTAFAGLALALSAQRPVFAQANNPATPLSGSYEATPSAAPAPPNYQPPYETNNPGVIYPPGVPQSFQPWPAVSPYHSAHIGTDQHVHQNGLWFRSVMHRQREYYGSVEAMSIWFRDAGGAVIGSPAMRIDPLTDIPFGVPVNPGEIGTTPDIPIFAPANSQGIYPVEDAVLPIPALGVTSFNDGVTAEAYPIHTMSVLGDPHAAPGILGRWGFDNEDGTGMMGTVWWGFGQNQKFQRGQDAINGVPVTQALSLDLGGLNLSPRYGVIPLDNGEELFTWSGTGSTAKYDVVYQLKFSTQAGGTNLSYYLQPLYRNGGIRIRPLVGARYVYLYESFTFRGVDSGFNYTVDTTDTGSSTSTFRPVTNTIQVLYDQYEANLSNRIQSNIAGPEIGLRFDLGDPRDGFSVWGETIFGLAANNQVIKLNGSNIGDPLVDARLNLNLPPRMLAPGTDTTFSQTKNHTHVSPVFQQSIYADMNLFANVPVLNKMHLLEHANFRLGYTLLYIGEVARPADSVAWFGFPLFPQIKTDYKNWWAHQLTLGVNWQY